MSGSAAKTAVLTALAANACLAVAKLLAAAATGSSAVLSEAVHSFAATIHQILMIAGGRQAHANADRTQGRTRDAHFWALVVGTLIFSLAAGVTIHEGIERLQRPMPLSDPWPGFQALGGALLVQATLVWLAARNSERPDAAQADESGPDPKLQTTLVESLAAIVGLLAALAGFAATSVWGWPSGDALASIVVGLVQGGVAAMLAIKTRALLVNTSHAAKPASALGPMETGETALAEIASTGAVEIGEGATRPDRRISEPPRKSYPPPKRAKGRKR